MDNETWEEERGQQNIFSPKEKGDTIEGEVITLKTGGYGLQATLKTKDGFEILTPSHKVLQSRLTNIKIGDYVKITFEGEDLPKVKGQKPTMIYKVMKRVNAPIQTEKV